MKKTIYLSLVFALVFMFLKTDTNAQKRLENGTIAPDFKVKDNYDEVIHLYESLKEAPVVLIFYRGEWCQYCNLYMHDLADSLTYITDLGAKIIAVTPESNRFIDETVHKTNASFSILYDKGHQIMDDYDVTWYVSAFTHFFYKLSGKDLKKSSKSDERALPVPATYIIGQDKKIIDGYFNKDYTKRMPVSDIVKVLEEYNKKK